MTGEVLEVIQSVHQQWLSRRPGATAQELLGFLNGILGALREWPQIIPLAYMIRQLDRDAAAYLRTLGTTSVTIEERQRDLVDDLEALECLIDEWGATVELS